MQVSINADLQAQQLTITLTDVDWKEIQERSFYQSELQVQQIVTTVGREPTRQLLERHDTSTPTIRREGQTW